MSKAKTIISILLLFCLVILTGCSSQPKEAQENDAQLPISSETGAPDRSKIQDADVNNSDDVILFICGGWDDEKNMPKEDTEYILSDEYAAIVSDLFYNHEKEILDFPIEDVASLGFQIGEDYLTTSMGALRTLAGKINGKMVLIELSESEYETIYQIVSTYAPETT